MVEPRIEERLWRGEGLEIILGNDVKMESSRVEAVKPAGVGLDFRLCDSTIWASPTCDRRL